MDTGKCLQGWCFMGIVLLLGALPAFAQITDVREYVIGIGDQLSINVWGIPELSSQVVVRLDEKITIPRLG
ncbi:MAG: sugar ABC transporter substrate-binding protein, partial [bacterium]|nr:sugar ABC transporter substrate-binding protein [bacterium]